MESLKEQLTPAKIVARSFLMLGLVAAMLWVTYATIVDHNITGLLHAFSGGLVCVLVSGIITLTLERKNISAATTKEKNVLLTIGCLAVAFYLIRLAML